MAKEVKTNAMRILDKNNIHYDTVTYVCEEFKDGMQVANMLGQDPNMSYKTLVTKGKSGEYFVFVIPIAKELDLKKAAKAVGEKSLDMIHVKEINAVTGYIRGGCTPIGMKKLYKTVVDTSMESLEKVIISGGRIGSQIILAPKDLISVTRAKYENITCD